MKKKQWLIGVLVVSLIGGVSLFTFNRNEKERKEQQMLKMETVTAKQIKNTFADVTEIKFSENYGENKLTGYTEVMVTVLTSYGVSSEIGVSMSPKDSIDESYLGSEERPVLKNGITESKVIVIFSNKEERSL